MEEKLIRSDEFPDDMVAMERLFEGNTVILCTLSMLSNPIVVQSGLTKLVPVERLIIDEASQIDVFEFLVSIFSVLGMTTTTAELWVSLCSTSTTWTLSKYVSLEIQNNVRLILRSSHNRAILTYFLILVPPYQAEQAGSQTIFEIKQLRRTKYFLNTQCETLFTSAYLVDLSKTITQTACLNLSATSFLGLCTTGSFVQTTRTKTSITAFGS